MAVMMATASTYQTTQNGTAISEQYSEQTSNPCALARRSALAPANARRVGASYFIACIMATSEGSDSNTMLPVVARHVVPSINWSR